MTEAGRSRPPLVLEYNEHGVAPQSWPRSRCAVTKLAGIERLWRGRAKTCERAREDRTSALPGSLHRYCWDYEPTQLTLDGSRQTILRRLLESGGWDAVVWLRREFGVAELCDGIPVSFPEYRYPSLAPRIQWSEYGCELASLAE